MTATAKTPFTLLPLILRLWGRKNVKFTVCSWRFSLSHKRGTGNLFIMTISTSFSKLWCPYRYKVLICKLSVNEGVKMHDFFVLGERGQNPPQNLENWIYSVKGTKPAWPRGQRHKGRRQDGIWYTGAINGTLDPVVVNRCAMTAQGIMKLAHALPRTRGAVRRHLPVVIRQRCFGAMTVWTADGL